MKLMKDMNAQEAMEFAEYLMEEADKARANAMQQKSEYYAASSWANVHRLENRAEQYMAHAYACEQRAKDAWYNRMPRGFNRDGQPFY